MSSNTLTRRWLKLLAPGDIGIPGRIITDKSSRAIIVRGRAEELSQAEKMLKRDRPSSGGQNFYLSNNLYREEEDLEK